MIIRSSLGLSFGVIFSVLLFKRRAWPVWLGTGFGAGRAWEEADGMPLTVMIPARVLADMTKLPSAEVTRPQETRFTVGRGTSAIVYDTCTGCGTR